jgi:Ca-activated chloride channel homolog
MRFGEAYWLWLLLLAPALAVLLLWAIRRRRRDLARWCHPDLWARMVPDRNPAALWWKGWLFILGVCCLVLMAARPQLGSRILSVQRKGIDVIIALDTSESMLAEDLAPNRITRARQEIQSLIERLRGDRVGLVAFSGQAFVQCPLTLDYAAARMFLRFMDTNLIPVPGTAMAEAIRAADKAFGSKERKFKALVLITDGEDHEGDVEEAAREAKEQGVRIFAVGIGTTKGEPIPMRDASGGVRDYKRDSGGNVIMSRLDPTVLRQICEETGGRYYDGGAGGLALDRLYAEISGMEQKEMKGGIVTQYEDRYVYFAAAAFFLLALEWILAERRRRPGRTAARVVTGVLLLSASLGLTQAARAGDKGGRAYHKGNYQAARDAYEEFARKHPTDPRGDYNLGTTLHQTGEMAPAQEALRRALRSPDLKVKEAALYNLGNTRARSGDLKGASEAYEMALRLRPGDRDAKHNLELVRALLQQPPPDSTKQKDKKQDKNQDKDKDKDKDQNKDQNKDQKKDQNKDQQQNQQDQPNPQDQQQQDQSQAQKKNDQRQDQQQPQDQQQAQQNAGQDQQGKPLPPMKISPEQARQILDGLAQQEMMLQAERLRARGRSLKVEKDW